MPEEQMMLDPARWTPEQIAELDRLYAHRVAIHEAGHALAIWYQDTNELVPDNWPIGEVAIRSSPDSSLPGPERNDGIDRGGYTSRTTLLWRDEAYRELPASDILQAVERHGGKAGVRKAIALHHRLTLQRRIGELAAVYAGPAAEAIYHNEEDEFDEWVWLDMLEDPEGTTDWQYVQHARTKLGRRWRLHMDRALERAVSIVRDHPRHIEALAGALIEHGYVDGEEVEEMFDRLSKAGR